MYFKLPIISYPTGVEGEFKNLPVHFVDSIPDFVTKAEDVLTKGNQVDYNLDFDYYSSESRKKEYKNFIRNL